MIKWLALIGAVCFGMTYQAPIDTGVTPSKPKPAIQLINCLRETSEAKEITISGTGFTTTKGSLSAAHIFPENTVGCVSRRNLHDRTPGIIQKVYINEKTDYAQFIQNKETNGYLTVDCTKLERGDKLLLQGWARGIQYVENPAVMILQERNIALVYGYAVSGMSGGPVTRKSNEKVVGIISYVRQDGLVGIVTLNNSPMCLNKYKNKN